MFQKATEADITSDDKLWALLAYIFTPIVSHYHPAYAR